MGPCSVARPARAPETPTRRRRRSGPSRARPSRQSLRLVLISISPQETRRMKLRRGKIILTFLNIGPRLQSLIPAAPVSFTSIPRTYTTLWTSLTSSDPMHARLLGRSSHRRSPEEERRRRTVPTEAAAIQASAISSYSLVSLLDLLGNTCMDASSKIKAPRQHAVTAHIYLPLTLTIGATPMSPSQEN